MPGGEWGGRAARAVALGVIFVLLVPSPAPGTERSSGARLQAPRERDREVRDPDSQPLRRRDALDRALRRGELSRAEHALERARTLFDLGDVRRRHGKVRAPHSREATPILEELSFRLGGLSPAERREAGAIFARPTDGRNDPLGDGYRLKQTSVEHTCFRRSNGRGGARRLCVHWATRTEDAPPRRDLDGNGIPDQVDDTVGVLREVWDVEVRDYGYLMPRRDDGKKAGQGPNRGTDIYLVDIGDQGLLGYCTSDEPGRRKKPRAYAYCVLDNDYGPRQYPGISPLDALRVAAAHEFFHVIQFAYEFSNRDRWLKEGTATWMEDEVYDHVDDNYSFLPDGALHQPEIPLNAFQQPGDGQDFEYGAWIFWRFLSEYFATPDVIRDVWEETAPGPAGDPTALEAVQVAASAHAPVNAILPPGTDDPYRRAMAEFGLWNAFYDAFYEEGGAYFEVLGEYPPLDAFHLLDGSRRTTGTVDLSIDHLSRRYVGISVNDPGATLRVDVDLPDYPRGPEATLVAFFTGGGAEGLHYRLDPAGDGTASFDQVSFAILMLHNTGGAHDDETYRYQGALTP